MSKVDAKNTQVVKEENQLGKHYMKIVEVVLNSSLSVSILFNFVGSLHLSVHTSASINYI